MEGSVFCSDHKTHQPVRSVSLPSRIHPLSAKLETTLNRLRIWQRSSTKVSITASFGSQQLLTGLINLSELYACVHELVRCPRVQLSLLHHQKGKLLQDALDGSIVLLDTCEAARDVLATMREYLQNLQSAVRRKGVSDSSIEQYINAYVSFRKKAKKEIAKHITELKKMEIKDSSYAVMNGDYGLAMVVNVLQKTITITVSIFRHLLLFLSTPSVTTIKSAGRFLSISNVIPFGSSSSSEKAEELMNEVQSLDLFLGSLQNPRSGLSDSSSSKLRIVTLQMKMDNLDSSFRVLEIGLDSVFKCLVQNRVSVLDILSCCS